MARLGRYVLPDQPLHVIQRGNTARRSSLPPRPVRAIATGSPKRRIAYEKIGIAAMRCARCRERGAVAICVSPLWGRWRAKRAGGGLAAIAAISISRVAPWRVPLPALRADLPHKGPQAGRWEPVAP